jgi:DNA-binding transcriptional regulator GbsR (MarR family)
MRRDVVVTSDRVDRARKELLEGVGAEIAASFPGITRLGGQVVAALYLTDGPRSMDELCVLLERSKSNIFNNLKGLEALGIVQRRREAGIRHDLYSLRGTYPDVIIGAYVARLRTVVADLRALAHRALSQIGDAEGSEADVLRARLAVLARKYELFTAVMNDLPDIDGPLDLERALTHLTPDVLAAFKLAAKSAWPSNNDED